jgi:hypothetical protein
LARNRWTCSAAAPVWRDLPSETQDALVNLMTQLMLEHAQRQASAMVTGEASHDH